ncbi:hypothetical protein HK098_005898 [Nowakowskiella sp. JEL0407]|nr:hypothetical protein HK098_005898 [Nowakowskiella sp. JEL0407]
MKFKHCSLTQTIIFICIYVNVQVANAQFEVSSNPLVYWTDVITLAVGQGTPSMTSPLTDRHLALIYGSIWEATLSEDDAKENYQYSQPQVNIQSDSYLKAIISYAAHTSLARLYPGGLRTYDAALERYMNTFSCDTADLIKAQIAGVAAADKIFASRVTDAGSIYVKYNTSATKDSGPAGMYIATAPSYLWPPVNPGARYIKPFVLDSIANYRLPPPPKLNSVEYLGNLTEVNNYGQARSSSRSEYDTITAYYWMDSTPIRFNKILRILISNSDFSIRKSARTFALMNFAMMDTAISAWDAKYQYNVWRPITLFRHEGAFLKNGIVVTNKTWTPLLTTPDHPDYTSGHSSIGRAATTVIQHVFGSDKISLTLTVNVPIDNVGNVTRQYTSLNTIAEENGRSRIFGGIHWDFSDRAGQDLGKTIANHIISKMEP